MTKTISPSSEYLRDIESGNSAIARILYAAESGSRLWRIDSADSDYDVRFIYLAPVEFHVTAFDRHDTFECVDKKNNIDVVGWELSKAVHLAYRYNVNLLEWLNSDIVYIAPNHYVNALITYMRHKFNPRAGAWHYFNLCSKQYIRYVAPSKKEIEYKKYFYVLRALMSAIWCIQNDSLPPLDFNILKNVFDLGGPRFQLPDGYHRELGQLLARKRDGELASGPRLAYIDDFIQEALHYFTENVHSLSAMKMGAEGKEELDGIYRAAVLEYFFDR